MRKLANNSDVYKYLQALSGILEERHANELSEGVANASRTAAGNSSTELLGESRIALERVVKDEHAVLTKQERDDVGEVLR